MLYILLNVLINNKLNININWNAITIISFLLNELFIFTYLL